MRLFWSVLVSFTAAIILIACSNGGDPPSVPSFVNPPDSASPIHVAQSSRVVWGLYEVTINATSETVEAVPLRTAMYRCNLNRLMETHGPKHLKFANLDFSEFSSAGHLSLDVGLEHPFPGLDQYTGFDVWGVFMHDGSGVLSYEALAYPVRGSDATLANADGYTRWFNMPEFTGSYIAGYTPGVAGTPGFGPSAELNGYKVLGDGLEKDDDLFEFLALESNFQDRLMFRAGNVNWREYDLWFPMVSGEPVLRFQYAVHASWVPPDPSPPLEVPEDFPFLANIQEAGALRCEVGDTLWYVDPDHWGGDLVLDIDVYDWQGAMENPDGIPAEIADVKIAGNFIPVTFDGGFTVTGGTAHYSTVHVEIPQSMLDLSSAQGNECWVMVESAGPANYSDDGLIPPGHFPEPAPLAAFLRVPVPVGTEPMGPTDMVDITPPGWPAVAADVWVKNDVAYVVGPYGGLLTLDVSGAGNPTYLGGYPLDGLGNEAQVEGAYCYVADGESGLRVLDVDDPSDPVLVASYVGTDAGGVFVTDDGYCYVADGKGGLVVLDVGGGTHGGSPDNPEIEGTYAVGYAALDVFVASGLAFVSDYETAFLVLDVGGGTHGGSPAGPQLEGSYPLGPNQQIDEIFVSGNYAYVAFNHSMTHAVLTLNVSIPSSPILADTDSVAEYVHDLWIDGGYLYAAVDTDGLRVLSLSNPANPSYVGGYNTPGNAFGVFKTGDYACVADYYDGLRKINVTNPSNPTHVGAYFTPHHPYDLDISGGFIYLADGGSGMDVVDIGGGGASPELPLQIARWDVPTDARGVFIEGDYAYLGGGWIYDGDLYIVDITSPGNPVGVGHYVSDYTYGLQKMGEYVFAACYESGLKVYDVDGGALGGSPSDPKLASVRDTACAWKLWAEGGYVYLADGHYTGSGFYVFDVGGGGSGSPTSPALADLYVSTPQHMYDVNVESGYAYVSGGDGLSVFDVGASIGAPDDIQFVGGYPISGAPMARGLCVDGGYVYLACSNGDLVAVDVGGGIAGGSPASPQLVDSVNLPGDCFAVMVSGQHAFVGSHTGGLRVVRLW